MVIGFVILFVIMTKRVKEVSLFHCWPFQLKFCRSLRSFSSNPLNHLWSGVFGEFSEKQFSKMDLSKPTTLAKNDSAAVPAEPKDRSPDVNGPTDDRATSDFGPVRDGLDGDNDLYSEFDCNGQFEILTLNSEGKLSRMGAEVEEPPKKRIRMAENSVEEPTSEETQERVSNDQEGEKEEPKAVRKLWEIYRFSDQIYKK